MYQSMIGKDWEESDATFLYGLSVEMLGLGCWERIVSATYISPIATKTHWAVDSRHGVEMNIGC